MANSDSNHPSDEMAHGMHSPLRIEHELLIAVCLEIPFDFEGLTGTRGGIDWSILLELATQHRVEGLLWQRLTKERAVAAPPELLAALERTARANLFDYLAKLAETSRICGLLESSGVRAIVLKGCAVGQRFFSPTAGLRFSSDIDILVAPERHEKAGQVLEESGFARTLPEPGLPPVAQELTRHFFRTFNYQHAVSGIVVELHHCLTTDPDALAIPFDELFERSLAIEVDAARFRGLSDEDCFLYLCCHGVRHGYERLKWLADTARAMSKLTDRQIEAALLAAKDVGCKTHLELSLHLLHQYGHPRVAGAIYDRREIDFLADLVRRRVSAGMGPTRLTLRRLPEHLSRIWYDVCLRESLHSRMMFLWELLVYVPDSRIVRLGKNWLWVYALVRGPSVLVRHILRMLGALRQIRFGRGAAT